MQVKYKRNDEQISDEFISIIINLVNYGFDIYFFQT